VTANHHLLDLLFRAAESLRVDDANGALDALREVLEVDFDPEIAAVAANLEADPTPDEFVLYRRIVDDALAEASLASISLPEDEPQETSAVDDEFFGADFVVEEIESQPESVIDSTFEGLDLDYDEETESGAFPLTDDDLSGDGSSASDSREGESGSWASVSELASLFEDEDQGFDRDVDHVTPAGTSHLSIEDIASGPQADAYGATFDDTQSSDVSVADVFSSLLDSSLDVEDDASVAQSAISGFGVDDDPDDAFEGSGARDSDPALRSSRIRYVADAPPPPQHRRRTTPTDTVSATSQPPISAPEPEPEPIQAAVLVDEDEFALFDALVGPSSAAPAAGETWVSSALDILQSDDEVSGDDHADALEFFLRADAADADTGPYQAVDDDPRELSRPPGQPVDEDEDDDPMSTWDASPLPNMDAGGRALPGSGPHTSVVSEAASASFAEDRSEVELTSPTLPHVPEPEFEPAVPVAHVLEEATRAEPGLRDTQPAPLVPSAATFRRATDIARTARAEQTARITGVRQMWERSDFASALAGANEILEREPDNVEAARLRDAILRQLLNIKRSQLEPLDRVPTVVSGSLARANLNARTMFIVSLCDGVATLEEIIDVCGIPREDAYDMAQQLLDDGILRFDY